MESSNFSLQIKGTGPASLLRAMVCILLCSLPMIIVAKGSSNFHEISTGDSIVNDSSNFYEISVFVVLKPLDDTEIPSLIDDEALLLSVADVLDYLQIKNNFTPDSAMISGFILNPKDSFVIDIHLRRIRYQEKTFVLTQDDLRPYKDQLFLKSSYFGEIFGLECVFYPRTVSVTLTSKHELPIVRRFRLEQNRSNFRLYDNIFIPNMVISQGFKRFFHLGTENWSINSAQRSNVSNYMSMILAIGGKLAKDSIVNDSSDFHEIWTRDSIVNDSSNIREISTGDSIANDPSNFYDISVFVVLDPLDGTEIPSIIEDEDLFLSVADVLDYLQIKNNFTPDLSMLSGFILNPQDSFVIDIHLRRIWYQEKTFVLTQDDVRFFEDQLFLESSYFGEIFGLECVFYPRTVSVTLTSKHELPIVRRFRLEQNMLNFRHYDNTFIPDTVIGQGFKFFHLGTANWSINSAQGSNGSNYTRMTLAMGGGLAGGEIKGVLTHTSNLPFSAKNQRYYWRYVNNASKIARQVTAGKIYSHTVSTIPNDITGIQVTNAPTYYRKSFGTYTYSGHTLANSLIEVYVNTTLVDYIRSDAVGFFSYNIPLSYGSTNINLRVYGPWGEEINFTKNFMIPFAFLPANELEYKVSAGMVEDDVGSFFSQGKINYGLTDNITIGAGLEYLSTLQGRTSLPFLNTSIKLSSGMYFTGEYVDGIRSKIGLTFRSPSQIQLELNYIKYEQEQEAVRYNYSEERKVLLSIPIRLRKGSIFSRMSLSQSSASVTTYYKFNWLLTLAMRGVNVNISNSLRYRKNTAPNIYGTISSSLRLPARIIFIPKFVYKYTDNMLVSMSMTFEKQFTRDFAVKASYEQTFDPAERYYRIGFKYNLPFANMSSHVNYSKGKTEFFHTANGSLVFDNKLNYLEFGRNSNVGRGGVAFSAFLDLNGNGKRDKSEKEGLTGFNVRIHRGGSKTTRTDSDIVVSGLEPYIDYNFVIDGDDFDNISWRILKPAISITIEPNQFKRIEIPVIPVGEVSGMVYRKDDSIENGIGRIKVNIYDKNSDLVTTVLTEEDGYFSHLGLIPGSYTVQLDAIQMDNLGMTSLFPTTSTAIQIEENIDGHIIDGLEFFLTGKTRN